MATSDDEIEEVIDDASVVSGDDLSLFEEVDIEVAFEGDVENSDDESAVRTKKKKLTTHTLAVDRNVDQSEDEDNIDTEKDSRRNSRRKGSEKIGDTEKPEGQQESDEEKEKVSSNLVNEDKLEEAAENKVRIIIEQCETPAKEDDEEGKINIPREEEAKTEQPKLKWHQRYALQKRKKWLWPRKKREVNEEEGDENEEEKEDEDGGVKQMGVEKEETKIEEEEDTEMTHEEKEDMYNAVRNGEYLLFQDLLDKKNADINMLWYRENLLMVAMRAQQMEMVEFLIDNGIDYNYETTLLDLKDREKTGKRLFQYKLSCRQMAYELDLLNVVEMIDVKNNQIHKYYKITPRVPRMRRPPAPTPPCLMYSDEEDEDEAELLAGGDSDLLSSTSQLAETSESKTEQGQSKTEVSEDKSADRRVELTEERVAELEITDDIYETPSPCPNNVVFNKYELVEERPGLLRRGTKSSIGLQQYNDIKYRHHAYSKSAHATGVVDTVGSYAWESRRWRPVKSASVDKQSEQSIPFVARMSSCQAHTKSQTSHSTSHPSRKQRYSRPRPLSSPASFSVEIQNILGQSRLLRTEPALPYIKPPNRGSRSQSAKAITPWCHSNSSAVFERLSNTKIHNKIQNPRFFVNRQISLRTNR
ncbi:uncharacterized protein LOC133203656 [Saccostrea echinata]|uniref:uncharacterized protein LOC133203656 n=1 Tax=Saccostrea echinata TaxID=191078 RepID=UPI002A801C95|nr:uncharacterized protein LOC133203656 [Saccostrea echinata]